MKINSEQMLNELGQPILHKTPVGGSCRSFKKGQWLIRRWSKENGGETDFVRYEKNINANRFEFSKFYRISKSKAENLTDCDDGLMPILKYFDMRMSLQFRPATKAEIHKCATLIMS